jgi:hypothetical protein
VAVALIGLVLFPLLAGLALWVLYLQRTVNLLREWVANEAVHARHTEVQVRRLSRGYRLPH